MSTEFTWSPAFQAKLLALYIKEPQEVYELIQPQYFTSPMHVDIARVVQQAYTGQDHHVVRVSRTTLLMLVKSSLGKKREDVWPAYKQTIKELFEAKLEDRKILTGQVLNFARHQIFRETLVDAEKDINAGHYEEAITRFEDLRTFGQQMDLGLEYWKDLSSDRWKQGRAGVVPSFYFPRLDRAMEGGIGAGELGIILAGGKKGKSTLLSRFAAGAMWRGKNVAIATGELSAYKYRQRIDAMLTSTTTGMLAASAIYGHENAKLAKVLQRAMRRLKEARGPLKGRLFIKQYPTGQGRVSDITSWLHHLERKHRDEKMRIDLVIVDYVRTFRPSLKLNEQRERLGQVAIDLRGLATNTRFGREGRGIPVWTAAQTTRGALSKENIGPEDFAEDISQFWTLDFLVALSQTKTEEAAKRARLILTAARDTGHGATIEVMLDRDTFRVWESGKRYREIVKEVTT